MRILLVYPNLMLQETVPNNLPILSACLKEAGHTVKLFDTTHYKTEEISNDERRVQRLQIKPFEKHTLYKDTAENGFLSEINSFSPDLVGFTFVDNVMDLGLRLLKQIPDSLSVVTLVGGVSAILHPQSLIKYFDLVCFGEGEKTIVQVCEYLEGKRKIEHIDNLAYEVNGIVKYNKMSEPLDINTIPFEDFTIFDQERLMRPMSGETHKTVSINLDRGCPFSCAYCCAPSIRKICGKEYYRLKTVERVKAVLDYQIKIHNPKYIYFNSETFLSMPLKKFKDFALMYKDYRIPFWCQTHVQTITDEKVRLLKEMGCDKLGVGIECGNEEYRRNVVKKYFSNQQAIDTFKILKKYNIFVGTNNILGFPDETREMIFDTIKLNRRLYKIMGKMDVSGFVFQPFKGTELRRYCEEKNYLQYGKKVDTLIGFPVITNPNLSDEELIGLLRTFALYIKMPKTYYNQICKAEQSDVSLEKLKTIYWRDNE